MFFPLLKKLTKPLLAAILIFAIGTYTGWQLHTPPTFRTKIIRENDPQYKFIKPLLAIDFLDQPTPVKYQPLRTSVNTYIDQQIAAKTATVISMYYRTLDSTAWTGINENVPFAPASMLKVALMMLYFHKEEEDPELLSQKVYFDGAENANENEFYKPAHPLLPHQQYTIDELIAKMIVGSDNNAMQLLLKNITSDEIKTTYKDLQLPSQASPDQVDFMSTQDYSHVFRILYSSTYFSRSSSEKALALLSQTEFSTGIVAGVPGGIIVSHKFGERSAPDVNGLAMNELHDCGVVYYPAHPYFLCVMTKGTDFTKLQSIIQDISKIVYAEVQKARGGQ